MRLGRHRVVITGLGAVTTLGSPQHLWQAVLAGKSGIRRLETIATEHLPVRIGAEVRDFDVTGYIEHKEARRMGRCAQFAVVAAKQALQDAGFVLEELEAEGERRGVVLGTTLGAHDMGINETFKFRTNGYRRPNPLNFVNCIPNMPAHYVSRLARAFGPLSAPSTACAAGTQSIGEGSELIRHGRCDVVLAGGVEAILQDYVLAGFESMNALAAAEYNESPASASRPFDACRSGFVMGEGCGIVVLESLEHARARGARIYCEVLGHASSSDAYHIAALEPEGKGAVRCMRWALQDAHLPADEIDYINAHGTSTPANDAMETKAIKTVFSDHAYHIPISSTKSMIGHAMAAAGAIEAIVCVLSLQNKVLHPTINYEYPDPQCDLDYVPNSARDVRHLKYVLSNSFGLGGQNAALVLGAL
ncbi:MAG: beta-ketoacyl-ACP synthase II [Chloroflexi bacterium]|nr:beta-ketoacyl-ACP synthase II [Chloroflexota bacterium]